MRIHPITIPQAHLSCCLCKNSAHPTSLGRLPLALWCRTPGLRPGNEAWRHVCGSCTCVGLWARFIRHLHGGPLVAEILCAIAANLDVHGARARARASRHFCVNFQAFQGTLPASRRGRAAGTQARRVARRASTLPVWARPTPSPSTLPPEASRPPRTHLAASLPMSLYSASEIRGDHLMRALQLGPLSRSPAVFLRGHVLAPLP